jgi:hypothetical protein
MIPNPVIESFRVLAAEMDAGEGLPGEVVISYDDLIAGNVQASPRCGNILPAACSDPSSTARRNSPGIEKPIVYCNRV